MKGKLVHITILLMVTLSLSGCHRKGRIIPASTLEKIYVDMFMADQWVKQKRDERAKADTTLFYEPIFRSYGYDIKDYDVTVSYYVDRPDKYVKILRRVAKTLNIRYLENSKIAERIQQARSSDDRGFGYVLSDFHNADSILFGTLVLDSLLVRDSVFIKLPEPDTLAVADTIAPVPEIDTTQIIQEKNVERRDSLRPHKKQAPRMLVGNKPVADTRQDL